MSNSRAARRRMARRPAVDPRSAGTIARLAGTLNAYYCTSCAGFTVTVDTARGTTPSMLACRAGDGSCGEMAVSLSYPTSWPAGAPLEPEWEWYRPVGEELSDLRDEEPEAYDHVVRGGLLLRPYRAGRRPRLADPPAARPVSAEDELERLRAGLAERGIHVADDDPGAVIDAALNAVDRRNLAGTMQMHISPAPDVQIVPVPYDPRTGQTLA
ncbi:hypothetical protein [Micromonospora haikouensis]|uniref:hypothetical protein n=1 Tax=Micromonospora haikouensis TaxID=686309 RepID=UPI003D731B7B